MIKYKGNTSVVLKDLCDELKIPVNLKTSEAILKYFFLTTYAELNMEKSIELISNLPTCLKPFYLTRKSYTKTIEDNQVSVTLTSRKDTEDAINHLFSSGKLQSTTSCIIKTLQKHVPESNMKVVLSLTAEDFLFNTPSIHKIAV